MSARDYAIGDRLSALRRDRKLSQEALAEKSGVSMSLITKLEQGRRHSMAIGTARKLAAALGASVGGLLGDDGAPVWSAQDERDRQLGARVRGLLGGGPVPAAELEAVIMLAAALRARPDVRALAEALTR